MVLGPRASRCFSFAARRRSGSCAIYVVSLPPPSISTDARSPERSHNSLGWSFVGYVLAWDSNPVFDTPFGSLIGARSQPAIGSSSLEFRPCYLFRVGTHCSSSNEKTERGVGKPGSNPRLVQYPTKLQPSELWGRSGLLASVEMEGEPTQLS